MGSIAGLRFGLATSVGSLACPDAASAVELALRTQPDFPTAPTLGVGAGSLLAQAVDGIPGVSVEPPGLLRIDPGLVDPGPAVAGLDGASFDTLRHFLERLAAPPQIGARISVLGPVTVALALRAGGLPVERAVAMAGPIVAARSVRMLGALRTSMPGGVAFVCASEPGMIGAAHPTFPLTPGQVRELLDPFVAGLDAHPCAGDLLIGVHVPGRTDWSTVISSGVSVISAPVEPGLVGSAEAIGDFLQDGGRVVWGAVPVDQPLGSSEELLWRRLSALWCDLVGDGIDPLLLRSSSLIGPVDGLGHFGPSQTEWVLGLVGSLSTRVRHQAIGARLSLGA